MIMKIREFIRTEKAAKAAGTPTQTTTKTDKLAEITKRARQLNIFIECSERALDAARKASDEAFERGDTEGALKITEEYETWYENNWKGE
jgi:hypothetical protein